MKGKRAEIAELCDSTQLDIMIITETKLDNSMNPAEFLPKNYDGSIHQNRNIHGGGVLIATKRGLVVDEVKLKASKSGEIICARLAMAKSSPLSICAYYRPPSDSTQDLDNLEEALLEISDLNKNNPRSTLILAGDFNARDIDWDNMTPKQECQKKSLCNKLINILSEANLHQMQRQNTREDAILDLLCTNKPSLVKNIDTIPGISDHDGIILADISLQAHINKKPQRRVPIWSKANWESMKAETAAFSVKFLEECGGRNVADNWDNLLDHLKASQSKNIPTKLSSTRNNVPWLTSATKKMCRKKHRLYKKAKKSQSPAHWAELKKHQNETRDTLRKSHWDYVNNILVSGLEKGDTKPFWSYIKSQKQDNCGVSALNEKGQLHSDAPSKARLLSNQFKSVFTKDPPLDSGIQPSGQQFPEISPLEITVKGVQKLLQNINPKKASGPDEVPARILHNLSDELAPALTAIFQQSINTGELPPHWKQAWITPVFKKGARAEPANYRPVSLTSIACKLLEHICCTHIRAHLDKYNILTPANHGFRAKHSTETQLLLTTHDMMKQRDLGKQIDVSILDFSKAFDTVPHIRLLRKLDHYGIRGPLLNWTKSFLMGRTQSVIVDGARSSEVAVESGVPQGTVMGPLLFLLHINDLPSKVSTGTRCRLFADDCLLYRVIHSIDDQLCLQKDLKALEQWADDWGMRFNASKCYIMIINRGRSHLPHLYELGGVILKSVESEKYLGVLISHDMSWSPHIGKIQAKANQKLGFIKRNLRGSPQACRKLAYIALVRAGMEYAGSVWDPHLNKDKDKLEKVQRRAVRWITRTHDTTTSVTSLMKKLNMDTLEERRRSQRLVFLYKILNGHVAVPTDQIDLVLSDRPVRGTSTKQKLLILRSNTTELQKSYTPRTIPQWNSLPQSVTSASSISAFKSSLQHMSR
jgi:hypothetical protein